MRYFNSENIFIVEASCFADLGEWLTMVLTEWNVRSERLLRGFRLLEIVVCFLSLLATFMTCTTLL